MLGFCSTADTIGFEFTDEQQNLATVLVMGAFGFGDFDVFPLEFQDAFLLQLGQGVKNSASKRGFTSSN